MTPGKVDALPGELVDRGQALDIRTASTCRYCRWCAGALQALLLVRSKGLRVRAASSGLRRSCTGSRLRRFPIRACLPAPSRHRASAPPGTPWPFCCCGFGPGTCTLRISDLPGHGCRALHPPAPHPSHEPTCVWSWVPAGTFTRTFVPSGAGTTTLAPNAASATLTGTSMSTSAPSRLKYGWSCMRVVTSRSPASPPDSAGRALAAEAQCVRRRQRPQTPDGERFQSARPGAER